MPNILVTTFGSTWAILPELISFCNYPYFPLFLNNDAIHDFSLKLRKRNIEGIDELWVISTISDKTKNAIKKFNDWYNNNNTFRLPKVEFIALKGIDDLTSEQECHFMTDLIFRVVLKASEYKGDGKLLLSLAGGRKTMSSDMQRASEVFGCDLLIHLADNGKNIRFDSILDLTGVLDKEKANAVFPVEVKGLTDRSIITEIPFELKSNNYEFEFSMYNEQSLLLYNEINSRFENAESNHYNLYKNRNEKNKQSIFYGLLQLRPSQFKMLELEKPDENFLSQLPKIDLHCHLGGILDVKGLIRVAKANLELINEMLIQDNNFCQWNFKIKKAIESRDNSYLRKYIEDKTIFRSMFPELPEPAAVAAFLNCFTSDEDYLEYLIYGDYVNREKFQNIGFNHYERLGDLQGSALLQSEASIKEACKVLLEQCHKHNIKYLELRCSPCNYTRGGLNEKDVISILYNNLYNDSKTKIRLIIIGSRHSDENVLKQHIDLTLDCKNSKIYKDFIVGFDIAGNESYKTPEELRPFLVKLMRECVKFTIHAGENQPVENIWQAVYVLNADRIGHGLTLIQKPELLNRFRDKNAFVELCPSSNYQICDYSDVNNKYPLRYYLNKGIKITINTDNPGISRTNLTNEYLFASQIADLTKLEVLNIIRNSVQAVFLPKDEKKEMMLQFEESIFNMLK